MTPISRTSKPGVMIASLVATVLVMAACKVDAQDNTTDQILKNLPPAGNPIKYDPVSKEDGIRSNAALKLSREAFALMDQGNLQQAERVFLQSYEMDGPNGFAQARTLGGLAELCNRERRYAEAVAYFRALYKHPRGSYVLLSARTHMEYALTLAETEQWPEAVAEYDQALVRIVVGLPAYYKAVKAMEAARREAEPGVPHRPIIPEEAMSREEMFKYLPQEWNVRFYADRPRYDAFKAMTHLFIGTNNAGFRYVPDAVQLVHVRTAVAYDPKNAYAYYEYGKALNKARQYTDAKSAFQKAGQLAGSNGELSDKIKPGLAEAQVRIDMLKPQK